MFSDSFVILSCMVTASTRDNKLSLPGVQSQSESYTKVQSNTSAVVGSHPVHISEMFEKKLYRAAKSKKKSKKKIKMRSS